MKKYLIILSAFIFAVVLAWLPKASYGIELPIVESGFTPKSVEVASNGGVYSFKVGIVLTRPPIILTSSDDTEAATQDLIIDPGPITEVPLVKDEYYYRSYSDSSGGAISLVLANAGGQGLKVDVTFTENNSTSSRSGYFIIHYTIKHPANGELQGWSQFVSDTIRFEQGPNQVTAPLPNPPGSYNISDGLSATVKASNINAIVKRQYTSKHNTQGAADGTYTASVGYYDNLGFGLQQVQVGAARDNKDLVTPQEYDFLWRDDVRNYLPYASNAGSAGSYKLDAVSKQAAYYRNLHGDVPAYAEQHYELSQRSKLLKSTAPGFISALSTTIMDNSPASFPQLVFRDGVIVSDGDFDDIQVVTVTSKDADWRGVRRTTDSFGKVLLEVPYGNIEERVGDVILVEDYTAPTYYVYDDNDLLRCVVPPEAAARIAALTEADIANYCYRYDYDAKERISRRRLPGRCWEELTYNNADQVVARSWDGKKVTTTYDALQRPLRDSLYEGSRRILLSEYTYDTYTASTQLLLGSVPTCDPRTKGLKTTERFAVLDSSPTTYVTRAYSYDYKGRIVRSAEQYPDGSILRSDTSYDFSGNPLQTSQTYTQGMKKDVLGTTYTYDSWSRVLSESTTLNNGPAALMGYGYDDQGRIVSRTYGNDLFRESQSYNIQGWQTSQEVKKGTTNLFRSYLRYYDTEPSDTRRSYTGNITEWSWQQAGESANTYAFNYDGLNRLHTTRQYTDDTRTDHYTEGARYDSNGNIVQLFRRTTEDISAPSNPFIYTYTGNRLTTLKEGNKTYTYRYDNSGNMTTDGAYNLTLSYNHLNLVENVKDGATTLANYSYLSDGSKLGATDNTGTGLLYRGSLVYSKLNGTTKLESAPFGGGRFQATSNSTELRYFITDHLGSVRTVVNSAGTPAEQINYYPFGMRWDSDQQSQTTTNRYHYNGKEEQAFVSVPYSDYGARMYDPKYRLGWNGVDPLASSTPSISPFAFCGNNPIVRIDSDGRSFKDLFSGLFIGVVTNITGDNSLRDAYVPDNPKHYNNALRATDAGMTLAGGTMAIGGGVEVLGGVAVAVGGTVSTGGAGAPVSVSVGATISTKGVGTITTGVILMKNAGSNLGGDYNYGASPDPNEGGGKVHGNSKESTKAQHNYDVVDTETGNIVKTGTSSGKRTKSGESYRAKRQVNRWNREEKTTRYKSTITNEVPAGPGARDQALKYEQSRADQIRPQLDKDKHIIP